MMFLIKVAFWLSVVILLLPLGTGAPKSEVGAKDALEAAQATIADMRSFCARQPEACVVGQSALSGFGEKAQAGAKLLYNMLAEPREAPPALRGPLDPADDPRGTLAPADQLAPWRGPEPPPLPRRRPA